MDESPPPPVAPLTLLQRRLVEAAAGIAECHGEGTEFLHSVLCQLGLPRARTGERRFQRNTGNAAIEIEAGRLYTGRKFVDAPMPYGVKPRLVLLHVCSEAVRTGNPEVQVGRTVRDFLGRLGLDTGGHEYVRFRAQMEALAACRMTIGMEVGGQKIVVNTQPISKFVAWRQHDGESLGMWPGTLTLSAEFLATLRDHAVPLDPRAIHALQHSALALDVYTWLAHRLCRIRKPEGVVVSWANLRNQFGQEYGELKDFKKKFKPALAKALGVYPGARVLDHSMTRAFGQAGGLRLYSSPPPIPKTKVLVQLPNAAPAP